MYGAYLTIAAGCAIIVLAVIGIFGAICDYKANRVLLFVVSFGLPTTAEISCTVRGYC